jgi:hypothetical protein
VQHSDPVATVPMVAVPKSAPPAVLTPKEQQEARKAYAKQLDQGFLDAGIESETRTIGKEGTTLMIWDPLAGRVRANVIGEFLNMERFRSLGFKKVFYGNNWLGYGAFEWDVN